MYDVIMPLCWVIIVSRSGCVTCALRAVKSNAMLLCESVPCQVGVSVLGVGAVSSP